MIVLSTLPSDCNCMFLSVSLIFYMILWLLLHVVCVVLRVDHWKGANILCCSQDNRFNYKNSYKMKIDLEAHKHPSINCKTFLLYFGIIMTD